MQHSKVELLCDQQNKGDKKGFAKASVFGIKLKAGRHQISGEGKELHKEKND